MVREGSSHQDPFADRGPSLVFVYGTLLRGQRNHSYLLGSQFMGAVRTQPSYTLVSLGAFPALRETGATVVPGELYLVEPPVLADLDRLEGHPSFYRRGSVQLEDGRVAITYFLPSDQYTNAESIPCWPPLR